MHRIDAGGCNRLKQRGKGGAHFYACFIASALRLRKGRRRARHRRPVGAGDAVRLYGAVAYAVTGNWHDAEDVLQETLLDACRTAPSYRPGTSACAWLLAIARHKALDCVRRTGVRRAETLDDDRAAEEPGFAAVEALDLLRALDEEEREVVILRVYAALPYKELAPLLGITVAAAQKRYQRAMEKLRAL